MRRILLGLTVALLITSMAYCQNKDEANPTGSMSGQVTAVDWVGSTLVVDNTRFIVPFDTEIFEGENTITFTEIKVGDKVKISYYQDSSGTLNTKIITVDWKGEFTI